MPADLSRFSLANMNIVVAGASRGIGYGISEALGQAGAKVFGFGRTKDVRSEFFEYRVGDVSNPVEISALLDDIDGSIDGSINAYFHVAGITLPTSKGVIQTAEQFASILNTNLLSAYNCCVDIASRMMKNEGGSIVTVTSIGSLLAFPNNPGYVSAKGGLRMMGKALALDFSKSNIRVNSIVPGYIFTDMTAESYSDPVLNIDRANRTMLGRWGTVDDLVGAAIFLASDASKYITGAEIVIDGGWTAKGL